MKIHFQKKLLVAALVPAFGMPLAASSFAQSMSTQEPKTGQTQAPQQGMQAPSTSQSDVQAQQPGQQATMIRDMRASKIIGANVQDAKGESLGEIQDLIVNTDDARVNYAIVAFGGALGFGEKLFAYPMDRFQASSNGQDLILSVSEQQMKNAPGFDQSNWPSFGAGGYRGELAKHFGQPATAGGNLVRISEMLNNTVVDRAGLEVGQINDVVVSVTDGTLRYVALEPVEDLKMEDRLVMLPANAIRATGQQQFEQSQQQAGVIPTPPQQGAQQQQAQDQELQLVLNIPTVQLQSARTVPQDQWPDLNNQAFQREMDQYAATFPVDGQAGESSVGASGAQEEAGSGETEPPMMRQEQDSQIPLEQEHMQQPQPGGY